MFERIAPRYDLTNSALSLGLHRRWKRALIRALHLEPGDIVLDAGTGTGDLAHLVASRGPRVIGVDRSAAMLAVAARRLGRVLRVPPGATSHIVLLRADLTQLPVTDGAFTAVMSAFVLRHLADLGQAFAECRRVLRPGGRIAMLEFGIPRRWFRPLYDVFSFRAIPPIGGLLTGDRGAYEFLVRSIRRFPEPDRIQELMDVSGFSGVQARPLSGGVAYLYTGTARTPSMTPVGQSNSF